MKCSVMFVLRRGDDTGRQEAIRQSSKKKLVIYVGLRSQQAHILLGFIRVLSAGEYV